MLYRNVRVCSPQVGLLGLWLILAAFPAALQAQGAGPEEITVTARKREENLQSVPVAISAFTADDLQLRDIVSLEKLADQTAGLSFATAGSLVNRRAVIRGMSQQTRVGDETNVATFVDGVYTPGFSGAEFFGFGGLERVEVVKGPQSALYGRNSFAGAINYVTAKPRYETEMGAQATYGSDERRGIGGYVSGPLIGDTLALRLDAGTDVSGGTNVNSLTGEALGSADTDYVRLGLRADPTDRLNIGLSFSWQDDDVNAVPATQVADDDPRRVGKRVIFTYSPFEAAARGVDPLNRGIGRVYDGAIRNTSDTYFIDPRSYAGMRRVRRAALDIEYDLGGMLLVSKTSWQDRTVDTLGDFNTCRPDIRAAVCDTVSPTAAGTFFGGPLANSPQIINVLTGALEDRDEISQDLRLQSDADGQLRWLIGGYVSKENFRDETQRLSDGDLTNIAGDIIYAVADPNPVLDSTVIIDNKFYSLYGSVDYDFSDLWSISAELRWTKEEKQTNQTDNRFPTNVPPTGFQEEDFDFLTPRVILSFTPNDDVLVYASAAKGIKSGGFNPGSVQFPTFDPEKNWTYELGSKLTFRDGEITLNSAVYFVDWQDQQITGTDPDNSRLPITQNVAETEIRGLEVELFVRPETWLQFNAGLSLIDAEYKAGESASIEFLADCDAIPIPCDGAPVVGEPVTSGSVAGRKVIGTPEASINAGVQINLPLNRADWEFLGRLDYSQQDKIFIDEANAGFIPRRETVNLRLGVQNDRFAFNGYCNNLTDDETPVFALPPRDILGVPHYFVINRDGRMCGVQASMQY